VFLNRRAAARYRALASIIPGRERPEETTVCYKISLFKLITNLNVILYLSTYPTVYIIVIILFMIILTYLLHGVGVLLEKLNGSAGSYEIPRIFGTRRFLTVPTSARHLSLS